jgi:PAS domain S-box-containing protein
VNGLGHPVCGAVGCARKALAKAERCSPELALIDCGLDGAAAAERIRSRCDIPVVIVIPVVVVANAADEATGELLRRTAATGPAGLLLRPFAALQLDLTIRAALAGHARERLQRRELEQHVGRLEGQTQLMETIFSSISDGVVVADRNGKFTMFNPSAESVVGIGKLDLETEQWSESYGVFQPDRTTRVATGQLPLVRAINGESTDGVELFIRNQMKPDGVFISVSGRPLDRNGVGAGGGVIVFRDITLQKRADAELEKTMAELRYQNELIDTAFRSISDGIVVANAKGEFLYVNPAAEQIVGMGITDAPQEEWAEKYGTYYPDRETPMPTEELPLLRAIHRGEPVDEEDVFIRNPTRPDGVYIRVSARPLLNDIGGIRGGVIVFRDVTARVFAEEALTQAFAEGRLEIVDTILHNIGNAITSVTTGIETVRRNLANDRIGRGLTELANAVSAHREDWIEYLRDDPQGRQVLPFILALAADYTSYTRELATTVERVRDRAQRIADIVRTQQAPDSAVMDRKNIDLHEALASGLRVLRDSLVKRGVRTSVDCRRAPREIRVRESQFHQMLVNLIKNAIEAIDELAAQRGRARTPSIRIRAYSADKYLTIEVADSGVGLRTRDTSVLFAPGYTTKAGGSGLGLHSAANFVIAAGGRIQPLSNGVGRGTTMRIMLPLSSVLPAAPGARAGST